MPKVSVIMSCYNHEKYIAEAINSVLTQTFQDFEIILINDGSTDNSSSIIQKIYELNKDKMIFIDHKINQRPRFSGSEGIGLASGEFIAWNDGDDIWYPTKLEKQMNLYQLDTEKSLGLVYCYGENIIVSKKRYRNKISAIAPQDDIFKQLFNSAFFLKISQVVRKEVYECVGLGNEKYPYCADWITRYSTRRR